MYIAALYGLSRCIDGITDQCSRSCGAGLSSTGSGGSPAGYKAGQYGLVNRNDSTLLLSSSSLRRLTLLRYLTRWMKRLSRRSTEGLFFYVAGPAPLLPLLYFTLSGGCRSKHSGYLLGLATLGWPTTVSSGNFRRLSSLR